VFSVQPWWRKWIVTAVVALVFAGLYEVTTHDARHEDVEAAGASSADTRDQRLAPGATATLSATAYCKGAVTASGVAVQAGAAASDPALLPLGSVVRVESGDPRYDGMYTVLDTGPQIRGRELDIYLWSCYEALDFGRRQIRVTVLRQGWDPRALPPSEQSLWSRLFRRRQAEPPAAPKGPPAAR
jgi:3D (Asp-Asp-Asp) domain-containing protein